ncbi:aromatic ring-hydroxylating dioxygenase subunit alpha (plasmid) [Sphingopyxis indica]|uniref:anthranilate 1,2-dioxygenase large subunit AndAc n=1 Tax=Sphingopyxis indica TaxID=436663 RepID=UPI0029391F3C|nr:anthranilate 1,2-dioxygenase large subunit AndAc [Sphingopyxis indica]WOF45887.1 aromatic ring-hydroxylating dioxygenase subunit alpha [Sphingopyxis indica]
MQVENVTFPRSDGSRVPYAVFSSHEIYQREQERIFRGETWSFLGLEAEIPNPNDFKRTFVGDTPVVMTRCDDGALAAWVNRCAHRGAEVCRQLRGNAKTHDCVYHQWSYSPNGDLIGVPFRRGLKGAPGMPRDFQPKEHGLRTLRVESYKGLVFATFSDKTVPLADYLGPIMRPYIDRIFGKPVVYLGCTRQYSSSNWKLYFENVKDAYHASLLHLFHTTFNIYRVSAKLALKPDDDGLSSLFFAAKGDDNEAVDAYKAQNIRSFADGFRLEDDSILGLVKEYDEVTTNQIQAIFPQLVIQQIHNVLCARQLLPKGPGNFELIFHFFGYEDDTPELRALRIKQANLVGPAGYISMEDTEATELVQRGTATSPGACSILEMGRDADGNESSTISEHMIRAFWQGYAHIMDLPMENGQ